MSDRLDELVSSLKALAEMTRVRIILALSRGELNVTELTYILDQSQPRVSRHLKLMLDAGIITRHKEGNWVLFRLGETGVSASLAHAVSAMLPLDEAILAGDLRRLDEIRQRRADAAASYFAANAGNWSKLRSLHVDEAKVESRIQQLVGKDPIGTFVDLGTGTGRMLELFQNQAKRLIGIDMSREMLSYARSNLARQNALHAQVRQANLYALPLEDDCADVVMLHQVLHYLDSPDSAVREAARILKPGGKLLIVDFAPHDFENLRNEDTHRRLGFSADQIERWLGQAQLQPLKQELLPPPGNLKTRGLTVTLVLAQALKNQNLPRIEKTEAA